MATPTALRVVEGHARVYRQTWRGSIISTFLTPVLTLLAIGVGLGSLIDQQQGSPAGVPYLVWLGPGLLAAAAMQTAAGDSSYPVMAGIKWVKSYDAALATPVGVADLVYGHLGWVAIRVLMASTVYAATLVVFGAMDFASGLAALGPALLTGLAFAAPITALVSKMEKETGLSSLFRFGIVPLFLFSGTFFPITQLPDWLEPVAYLTPLWHGVELCRAAAGVPDAPHFSHWIHFAYLLVWVAGGTMLALRLLRKRMVK